jgi:hypothetical protein
MIGVARGRYAAMMRSALPLDGAAAHQPDAGTRVYLPTRACQLRRALSSQPRTLWLSQAHALVMHDLARMQEAHERADAAHVSDAHEPMADSRWAVAAVVTRVLTWA